MTEQELEAIAGGYHGDAFAVLGPHATGNNGKTDWEIRAFLPHAKEAAVAFEGASVPMERAHTAGLFSARVPTRPAEYKLHITDHQGNVTEAEDAYRFPPLLTEFDLHLHSEGTNYEGYTPLAHIRQQ